MNFFKKPELTDEDKVGLIKEKLKDYTPSEPKAVFIEEESLPDLQIIEMDEEQARAIQWVPKKRKVPEQDVKWDLY
jgi:hypothetical protein